LCGLLRPTIKKCSSRLTLHPPRPTMFVRIVGESRSPRSEPRSTRCDREPCAAQRGAAPECTRTGRQGCAQNYIQGPRSPLRTRERLPDDGGAIDTIDTTRPSRTALAPCVVGIY
jgi:hypothetical protein